MKRLAGAVALAAALVVSAPVQAAHVVRSATFDTTAEGWTPGATWQTGGYITIGAFQHPRPGGTVLAVNDESWTVTIVARNAPAGIWLSWWAGGGFHALGTHQATVAGTFTEYTLVGVAPGPADELRLYCGSDGCEVDSVTFALTDVVHATPTPEPSASAEPTPPPSDDPPVVGGDVVVTGVSGDALALAHEFTAAAETVWQAAVSFAVVGVILLGGLTLTMLTRRGS